MTVCLTQHSLFYPNKPNLHSMKNTNPLPSRPADLNTFDDPLTTHPTTATAHTSGSTSSRTPLTGTIGSSSFSSSNNNASAWTSRIPGQDRAAPLSTIDETVWATLRRD